MALYTRTTHTIKAAHPRDPSTVTSSDVRLELVVDEYIIPNSDPSAQTLVLTHGTSFNKRLWEPTISRVLHLIGFTGSIKRILAIDATNHGESWLLNAKRLTEKSHWPDQSRDILETLRYFDVQQPVIGIGHSFGGGILCHAAFMNPHAFAATIFVDPILFRMDSQDKIVATRALKRRDRWDDLESVRSAFAKNKGLADWHPDVLSLYVEHGTVAYAGSGSTSRTLTTPKEQEAATYLAAPFFELPKCLAASQQTHYFVLGAQSIVLPSKDREWIKSISKSPGRVIVLDQAGHLIPMTHPDQLATELSAILTDIWNGSRQHRLRSRAERL
ncbi:Alpha/Beta hydrolase protein [Paraphoma chrysanthemicola]|uniref:Alpha/Beta hydrolase protein n=1 Tax=Paraphoma chrysanthemicola TaxID=798071 RepID=A0A8K0RBQ5_9PLEO|nr:Alpha/Beta hydrolase protein [Paraphoma chrysanthemicola]